MSYLSIQYGGKRVPKTNYPAKLVKMLMRKYKIPAFGSMVEIGCGRGDFAKAWKDEGMHVLAVDREKGIEDNLVDRFEIVDITDARLPATAGSKQLVFHKSLLEHIQEPGHLMFESHRVLAPGGKAIIMCPDWRTYLLTFYDDFTHVRPYDKVSLKDLMEFHGFTDVTVDVIPQYPAAWDCWVVNSAMTLFRWVFQVDFALWLTETTGIQFFKWACQLTLVGVGVKRRAV